ncbi:MAG TPA: hypothetical protein P5116_02775 [Eubacteriales bacterium]|nr:hypothetical protein [Clostridia bacterium]HRV72787.1 hypothetical protein [Eubacteriales bacterium]
MTRRKPLYMLSSLGLLRAVTPRLKRFGAERENRRILWNMSGRRGELQERMEICAANALKAAQNQLEEIYHEQKQ